MTTLELQGHITKKGKLEVHLPAGLPEGDVKVRIDLPDAESDWENQPWTEDEIRELMTPNPKSGAEIVAWLKANPPDDPNWGGITDDKAVGEYVHNMRRDPRLDWGKRDE